MRIKYINTGCMRGGQVFPAAGCMEIVKEKDGCDIFVLVEASENSEDFDSFKNSIAREGFKLYKSTPHPESNQVMIGGRSQIKVLGTNELGNVAPQKFTGRGVGANSVASSEVAHPNYLRVTSELNGEPTDIIGGRIPHYGQFKNGNAPTPKCYNAELCSFRQMLEALERDLNSDHKAVLLMDGNNALHYGDFYGPYDPNNYIGKAQKNYNFHVLRDELYMRNLILKEGINDSSWHNGIHLDHAFFKKFDINAIKAEFFYKEGFDHKGISITI